MYKSFINHILLDINILLVTHKHVFYNNMIICNLILTFQINKMFPFMDFAFVILFNLCPFSSIFSSNGFLALPLIFSLLICLEIIIIYYL